MKRNLRTVTGRKEEEEEEEKKKKKRGLRLFCRKIIITLWYSVINL
jgi:hypothetical protein